MREIYSSELMEVSVKINHFWNPRKPASTTIDLPNKALA